MSVIYVARSKSLSDWGASVGISKSLFKVGVADSTAKAAVAALNNDECAGLNDWRLVGSEDVDDLDEAISGEDVILEPFQPAPGLTVVFVLKDGAVVEYMDFGEESDLLKIDVPLDKDNLNSHPASGCVCGLQQPLPYDGIP